ncbi:unnamed protein product [Caenorhabditis angaria]|uniref:Uncharacterized protein n=1 Tax=Caenorhabditis angaria TaxID=860376 RepID=A0A9P1N799_9PELO|nr:unnamed protein product [Caenorhabditis angaria]
MWRDRVPNHAPCTLRLPLQWDCMIYKDATQRNSGICAAGVRQKLQSTISRFAESGKNHEKRLYLSNNNQSPASPTYPRIF